MVFHSESWLFVQPLCRTDQDRRYSSKTAFFVKGFFLLQRVVTRSRQFVRQRLGCDRGVRPGFLAFVEALGLFTITSCKIGRFDKRPGEVFVAVPDLPLAFLLAVTGPHTIDTTRVRSKMPDGGKTFDRSDFQQDYGRQGLT